jgi:hypothetical protein
MDLVVVIPELRGVLFGGVGHDVGDAAFCWSNL